MPKLLVLFQSRTGDTARLAEAVADGARSVRFAEVDLRRVPPAGGDSDGDAGGSWPRPASAYRPLDADDLSAYDAILAGVSSSAGADAGPLVALIAGGEGNLSNKVGSAFTTAAPGAERDGRLWSVLTPMADRRMILVPASFSDAGDDPLDAARRLGKRVADIVGWVLHARSHHHHH